MSTQGARLRATLRRRERRLRRLLLLGEWESYRAVREPLAYTTSHL